MISKGQVITTNLHIWRYGVVASTLQYIWEVRNSIRDARAVFS
jgi:hypothetical protein